MTMMLAAHTSSRLSCLRQPDDHLGLAATDAGQMADDLQ
jgi:hypothetical protein